MVHKCPICGREFEKEHHLKNHILFHKDGIYRCLECGKELDEILIEYSAFYMYRVGIKESEDFNNYQYESDDLVDIAAVYCPHCYTKIPLEELERHGVNIYDPS